MVPTVRSAQAPSAIAVPAACRGRLGAGAGSGVGGTIAGMATARFTLPCVVPVAGVSHRQEVVHRIRVGDPLVVRRDPTNPYDAHAVTVETLDGAVVGYLPRTLVGRVDADRYRAVVDDKPCGGPTVGVRVRLLERVDEPAIDGDSVLVEEATVAEPVAVPVTARMVLALSGRELGAWVRTDGDHVVVDRDGEEAIYPARLVTITEPAPAAAATTPDDAATAEGATAHEDVVTMSVPDAGVTVGATELARALGVTVRTVHRWASRGLIPVVVVAGRRRFVVADVRDARSR